MDTRTLVVYGRGLRPCDRAGVGRAGQLSGLPAWSSSSLVDERDLSTSESGLKRHRDVGVCAEVFGPGWIFLTLDSDLFHRYTMP